MIGISKLYFGTIEESDKLRYRKGVHRRFYSLRHECAAIGIAFLEDAQEAVFAEQGRLHIRRLGHAVGI